MSGAMQPPVDDPCDGLQDVIARLNDELYPTTPQVRVTIGPRFFLFDPYNLRAGGESANYVEFEQAAALLRIAADWYADEAARAKAETFPPRPADEVRDELLDLYRRLRGADAVH